MADIFYILLFFWVLWQIFGSTKKSAFQKHLYQAPRTNDGDVVITSTKVDEKNNDKDRGEYVDYEEVK